MYDICRIFSITWVICQADKYWPVCDINDSVVVKRQLSLVLNDYIELLYINVLYHHYNEAAVFNVRSVIISYLLKLTFDCITDHVI
jgi:hypothetical protein